MIKKGESYYQSIEDALSEVSTDNKETVVIEIDGTVNQSIVIDKPNVILCSGEIDNDLGAYEILEDGLKRGTFRTYTVYVCADNVTLRNMTVRNSSGYYNGQAVALMIDGNDFKAENCLISSYQDTLFIGPLPETEYEKGGFRGPMEHKERIIRNAEFRNCIIEGSVDFIFGGGFGYFENCEIRSRNVHQDINGYVCAPSTPEYSKFGFIFNNCDFTSEDDMDDSVYLARPWRNYGKCMIVNSKIGNHVKRVGYHDWNKPDSHETCEFKEFNTGIDLSERVSWLKNVTEEDFDFISSLIKEDK